VRTALLYLVVIPVAVLLAIPAGFLLGYVVGRATATPRRPTSRAPTPTEVQAMRAALAALHGHSPARGAKAH
jgi:hypothetical protein